MNQPPNILLLQCEDTGRHLGCYGDTYARTPHMDQLAREGVRYSKAYTHAPVCAPSRGGMVTGCYPWTIGNHHMRSTLSNPPRCFTHELVQAGYHVSWPTKLDFNFEPAPGWCCDQDPWWDKPPPGKPFFFYENFVLTHESRMFREPPEWHGSAFPCPEAFRHDPAQAPVPPCLPDLPELRRQIATYYDAVSAIDHQIGQRLKWLDDNGLRDSTMVILLSDHGRGLPREKRWCYEAGLHLPLIIRWPGHLPQDSLREHLVAWVDIAPTLLSVAGVGIPGHYQGNAFLGPKTTPPRPHVFAGRDRMDENFDKVRAAGDGRYLYLRNDTPGLPWAQWQAYMEQQPALPVMRSLHAGGRLRGHEAAFFGECKPPEELYDTTADPHQLHNLAGDPDHASTLDRLREALEANLDRFGDLGETDEAQLVRDGILTDRLAEYRQRSRENAPPAGTPLPGPPVAPMTLGEARPFARGT